MIVKKEVFTTKFYCNLEKCKGACCTMHGEYGAPLKKNEILKIEKNMGGIFDFSPISNRRYITKFGFWEEKHDQILIKSIRKRDCVFVYYENEIAKCAIERAYYNGDSDFKKPISCHLFPIRVNDFGGPILKYEKYNECKSALEFGETKNVTIAEFCIEALERSFGKKWIEKLHSHIRNQ
ncbi:DUF3109 family protein [Bacteroidota bacterium]